MAELGKRFARFREERRPGARFPDELKEAALAAMRQAPAADVYRACGVSFRQVMAWKAAKAHRGAEPEVRVFTVVDDEAVALPEPTVSITGSELELRIGPWSVSVRLAGQGSTGRG